MEHPSGRASTDFSQDVRGEAYRQLVDAMRKLSVSFGFVVPWRKARSKRADPALAVAQLNAPYLISREESKVWPRTRSSRMSLVFTFRMSGPSGTFLREQADGLFAWCFEDDRPEDLFFCASDGEVLLSTTAHERCGTLSLSKKELSVFLRAGSELAGWEGSRILAKHYHL